MKFYGPSPTMIDFPGMMAVTVFTRGCNLRCPICHNPSLVLVDKHEEPEPWTLEEVLVFAADKWADGICITGGEPTIHADLPDVLKRIKDETDLKVKLDTNGVYPVILKKLLDQELVDFVALDVKAPLRLDMLDRAIGFPWNNRENEPSLVDLLISSIAITKRDAPGYHFRTVCFEKFLSPKDVGAIAKMLAQESHYLLLPFDPHNTLDPALRDEPPSSPEYMNKCLAEAQKYIPNTRIGGM